MIDDWKGFHVVVTACPDGILRIYERVGKVWHSSYYRVFYRIWGGGWFTGSNPDELMSPDEEVIDAW